MSIKIYEAYKVESDKFNDYLDSVKKVCYNNIKNRLEAFATCVKDDQVERWIEYKFPDNKHLVEKDDYQSIKIGFFAKLAKESLNTKTRNFFSIECSLNVWYDNGFFYIIPIGENWIFKGICSIEIASDYCYYNNTDEPEGMTEEEWKDRRNTWDRICLNDHNKTRMNHEVVNPSNYDFASQVCDMFEDKSYWKGVISMVMFWNLEEIEGGESAISKSDFFYPIVKYKIDDSIIIDLCKVKL